PLARLWRRRRAQPSGEEYSPFFQVRGHSLGKSGTRCFCIDPLAIFSSSQQERYVPFQPPISHRQIIRISESGAGIQLVRWTNPSVSRKTIASPRSFAQAAKSSP